MHLRGIFARTWRDCTTVAQTVDRSNGGAREAHSNSHREPGQMQAQEMSPGVQEVVSGRQNG